MIMWFRPHQIHPEAPWGAQGIVIKNESPMLTFGLGISSGPAICLGGRLWLLCVAMSIKAEKLSV